MSDKDLSQCSLMELFHTEAETQLALMTSGLLALEKDPSARVHLEELLFYPVQYEGEECSRNVFYTGAAPNQQAVPAVPRAFHHGRRIPLGPDRGRSERRDRTRRARDDSGDPGVQTCALPI